MQIPNKLYDVLKWITMIVLPALATAYVGLAGVWGWPWADEVAKTTAVVCTLLGALLGISTAEYNRAESDYRGQHEAALEPVEATRKTSEWAEVAAMIDAENNEKTHE